MKLTTCKRCDAKNVFWTQDLRGKWTLNNETGGQHHCDDGKIKAVNCKYCNASDLHWAEEVTPGTQSKKMVLTESYGLPHACDARIAFLAKEKQDKKDKYEAEKRRIAAHPDGTCIACKGNGFATHNSSLTPYGVCPNCHGQTTFSERTKKAMLAQVRSKIWPNMKDKYSPYKRHY